MVPEPSGCRPQLKPKLWSCRPRRNRADGQQEDTGASRPSDKEEPLPGGTHREDPEDLVPCMLSMSSSNPSLHLPLVCAVTTVQSYWHPRVDPAGMGPGLVHTYTLIPANLSLGRSPQHRRDYRDS